MIEKYHLHQFDWFLVIIVLILCVAGIATIQSATHLSEPGLYQRQTLWLLIGAVLMVSLITVDYSRLERFAYIIYGLSMAALLFSLFFGKKVAGAQRWIDLGFVSFQPAEFAKIAVILAVSKHLAGKGIPLKGLSLGGLIAPALLFAPPFLLIARQPDLGTAFVVLLIFSTMLLVAKIRTRALVFISLVLAAALPFGWGFLKGYQKARLMSFFNPSADPLGSGYHLIQSKIAVGSGGFLGKGYMEGTQGTLEFLPEHHTDFIFSVLAEEWGFLGVFLMLGMFLILILRGLDIAANAKCRFGFFAAFGMVSLLFWHVAVNIAMTVGMLPVVGVPLPFLSYGGSFLVTMFLAVGVLLNIRMRRFSF
jgi:rod shape determining protein RodA